MRDTRADGADSPQTGPSQDRIPNLGHGFNQNGPLGLFRSAIGHRIGYQKRAGISIEEVSSSVPPPARCSVSAGSDAAFTSCATPWLMPARTGAVSSLPLSQWFLPRTPWQ